MPQRPDLRIILLYAIGQFGWSLCSFGAGNLLVYFYMPPETGQSAFPAFIFQGPLLFGLTLIGLINFGGRLFDALTDPWIASLSDRSRARMGKRRWFMALAALPFALLSWLIFLPPADGPSALNGLWLGGGLLLFYLSLTAYVVPYTALISELGHVAADRLRISTAISVAWALGFMVGQSAYALQSWLEADFGPLRAFQIAIGLFALIGLLAMLLPVFFLDERRYCRQQPSEVAALPALRSVLRRPDFRIFALADLSYWLALTFIQLGIGFFVTIQFGMDKGFASLFMGIAFVASLLCYALVNWLARRWGKKRVMHSAFAVFSLIFVATALVQALPLPREVLFYLLALLAAWPLAVFGILPNAIIADQVHLHEAETGGQHAGMFFAVRTLMMKLGISLANLLFPSLLLLGRSPEAPMGVQAAALAAALFCLLGWALFRRYPLAN